MKIRTTLTLKYAAITAAVLAVSMAVVYGVSEQTRSRTFYHHLRSEAITKAHLFLSGRVDAATMQSTYLNNKEFIDEVEVAIYTPRFEMLYHDAVQSDIVKESADMVARIARQQITEFRVGRYQAVGILYHFRGTPYVVTAAAYDGYGYDNMAALRRTLFLLFAAGITLLWAVGYLFAWSSLRPIRHIARQMERLTASEIGQRLPVANRDEIGELCLAFNALLQRLERSFEAQKMFVSNVSHELRTPLAALTAELDLALQKEARTEEQYRLAIGGALSDARQMNRLVDGLLNLAKADYGREQMAMQALRLDELLLDAGEALRRAHTLYRIDIVFDQEIDDERLITVHGNPYLLTIAFSNLMDNNCKYSPNHASFVQIAHWEGNVIVRLSDTGAGISEADKAQLFTLFHRGRHEPSAEGHGIGMALARKIIRLHKGDIAVHSIEGEGTTFIVELPHEGGFAAL